MVAGLLRQPRARRGRPPSDPPGGTTDLYKEIQRLEKELSEARSLIAILRELPAHRDARESSGESSDGRERARETVEPRREAGARARVDRRQARRAPKALGALSVPREDASKLGAGAS
jgi:hypothetical protein